MEKTANVLHRGSIADNRRRRCGSHANTILVVVDQLSDDRIHAPGKIDDLPGSDAGSYYRKVGQRNALAIAIVSIGATFDPEAGTVL